MAGDPRSLQRKGSFNKLSFAHPSILENDASNLPVPACDSRSPSEGGQKLPAKFPSADATPCTSIK
jgi:hypothetical protein